MGGVKLVSCTVFHSKKMGPMKSDHLKQADNITGYNITGYNITGYNIYCDNILSW